MSKNMEILRGSKKKIRGVDEENIIQVGLVSSSKTVNPEIDATTIDVYKQYIKEKDNASNYRFTFTINPVCSNVLYNKVSEIVYKEGSDDCITIGKEKTDVEDRIPDIKRYHDAINRKGDDRKLSRFDVIRDTTYSHPNMGNLVYHCGADIFNNHYLRKSDFSVIGCVISDNEDTEDNKNFNTISDIIRDDKGEAIKDIDTRLLPGFNEGELSTRTNHIYHRNSLYSFPQALKEREIENENGWWGFLNPTSISIKHFPKTEGIENVIINKCMNNNKANEQYDFYPDRSLYSFTPKYNRYRERLENNWDICLTYPAENKTDHEITTYQFNGEERSGLKATLLTKEIGDMIESDTPIYFETDARHNLTRNDVIAIDIKYGDQWIEVKNLVKVFNVGNRGDYDLEHAFSVVFNDIDDYIDALTGATEIRIARKTRDKRCKYYFRVFKKITNFKRGGETTKFNTSLNRLGFSRNIYGDDISQIVFNESVFLEHLRDNLNRPLSEVFLTIVKSNRGYKKWYNEGVTNSEDIEYSHCFGKISSGMDFLSPESVYNIHRIHNIDKEKAGEIEGFNEYLKAGIPDSSKCLEDDITIDCDSFLGDLVEFDENALEETVLEYVYHRFNTAQREYVENEEYADIRYEEIKMDDFDIYGAAEFEIKTGFFNSADGGESERYPINIYPEGYYYNPHYPVTIKQYSENINMGQHTLMNFVSFEKEDSNYIVETAGIYYLSANNEISNITGRPSNDELIAYNKKTNKRVMGKVVSCDMDTLKNAVLTFDTTDTITKEDWAVFKVNKTMPESAYELNDGTGLYIWRDVKSCGEMTPEDALYDSVFTNNALYIHRNINFFLRRQDPFGIYKLNNIDDMPINYTTLLTAGREVDVTGIYYIPEANYKKC